MNSTAYFCYCPLYLHPNCGGDEVILESGVKDCSSCTKNHDKHSWKFVINKLRDENDYQLNFNEVKKDD